jgi:ADP-heptose:LPS heptosyltransferase
MIVLAPTGSTPPKFWPHVEALARSLTATGAHVVVLGDLRGMELPAMPGLHCIGTIWPIRNAIALAQCADVVIGQETAILNAVAMEPMRKIVLLSHSTVQNLTRHWVNTVSLNGRVPCYPCHRIHQTFEYCTRDQASGTAACQNAISAEQVLQVVQRALPSLATPAAA